MKIELKLIGTYLVRCQMYGHSKTFVIDVLLCGDSHPAIYKVYEYYHWLYKTNSNNKVERPLTTQLVQNKTMSPQRPHI